MSIKPERFLLSFGDTQLLAGAAHPSGVYMRAVMHLYYRICPAFGFEVTIAQCCHGFLRALLSCLTMQNRKRTQMVPQNEAYRYCLFYLQGLILRKLIHCKAMRPLNLPPSYFLFHITVEHGEINCGQGRDDRKSL